MEKENIAKILKNAKNLYFIGIGGISMHSLAQIAAGRGYTVAGTDRQPSDITKKLEAAGIKVNYAHAEENVCGFDAVIYTAAVAHGCPELDYAQKNSIPCLKRAEFLGYIMCDYRTRIGVAGMHGKSTATSMLSYIFMQTDRNPTIVNGARLDILGGASRIGAKDYFLFEACEYTDSFLSFYPTISVVLNVDLDHTDYFSGIEQIKDSFAKYMSISQTAIVNADDANAMEAASKSTAEIITFAIDNKADYTAENLESRHGRYSFDFCRRGEKTARISLSVFGRHNVYDALACAACADICGVSCDEIASGLAKFKGAERRFEYKGECRGRAVYDDYAHHPSEIRATLEGAKKADFGRVICIFQPHTYSRTAELFCEFTEAFDAADSVIFADIYAARETDTMGVSSSLLAEKTAGAVYASTFEAAAELALKKSAPGDLIITMGAGDVHKVATLLIDGGE